MYYASELLSAMSNTTPYIVLIFIVAATSSVNSKTVFSDTKPEEQKYMKSYTPLPIYSDAKLLPIGLATYALTDGNGFVSAMKQNPRDKGFEYPNKRITADTREFLERNNWLSLDQSGRFEWNFNRL